MCVLPALGKECVDSACASPTQVAAALLRWRQRQGEGRREPQKGAAGVVAFRRMR